MPRKKYWKRSVNKRQQMLNRIVQLYSDMEAEDSKTSRSNSPTMDAGEEVPGNDESDTKIEPNMSDDVKKIFKISFDVEKFLDEKLKELDIVGQFTQELSPLSNQLKAAERKQKEITRLFTECEEQLQFLQESLNAPDKEEDRKSPVNKPVEEVIIDDSDDDDVLFLEATKPTTVKRKSASSANRSPAAGQKSPSTVHKPLTMHSGTTTAVTFTAAQPSKPGGTYGYGVSAGEPSQSGSTKMTQLRAALAATLNQQITNTASATTTATSPLKERQSTKPDMKPSSVTGYPADPNTSTSDVMSMLKSSDSPVVSSHTTHYGSIPLTIGMKILGKKFNDIWYKGTLTDIQCKEKSRDEWRYRVKFDGKGLKVVTGRHLAYWQTSESHIPVGSRVVAMYRDEDNSSANSFYAGIVAEPLSVRNNHRLLVFFDDGYAQYCTPQEIHNVCDQSIEVWRDIHPDSQDFIREYLKQYPERPMVRLQKGQIVKTEWNGKWWTARVIDVDASLAKMFFDADKRTEWIYRGSTRLEPLYSALCKAAIANEQSGKARRNNPSTMKGAKKPVVEYMRGGEEEKKPESNSAGAKVTGVTSGSQTGMGHTSDSNSSNNSHKKRSVAKKSTGGKSQSSEGQGQNWEAPWLKIQRPKSAEGTQRKEKYLSGKTEKDMASVLQKRLASCSVDNDGEEDLSGEGMDITNIPVREVNRVKFVTHTCSRKCNELVDDDPAVHRGKNPLLIPMHCGWERQITKTRPLSKRLVFYKAPCGRRLRNIDEVDKFLLDTDCKLTIDLFCFDPSLHTNTEIVPVKTFCDIKDLSYGKELVPISCVNGIDRQYPDYVEYSNQRMPCKGVSINLDQDFLVCCDCTDGCRDRSKCACCQQTVEMSGVTTGGHCDPSAGYQDRRLKEPLLTGIYECNARCKCDNRCHNRVAQNGLSLRLQVFKTENRGWGLRCLDDVPCGGFICIYAGQLLTEQGANEDGQTYGDEYLAELDYMEVVESHKEGYESDVPDLEDNNKDGEEEEEEDEDDDEGVRSSSSDSDFDGGKLDVQEDIQELRTLPARSIKVQDTSSTAKTADWLENIPSKVAGLDDGEGDNLGADATKPTNIFSVLDKGGSKDGGDSDELPDLDEPLRGVQPDAHKESRVKNLPNPNKVFVRAHRSMGGAACFDSGRELKLNESGGKEEPRGTRFYFQDGQQCYVMDAKSMGNIGRYLNHSCSPNVFVQNVFVDTHDLRFPWVAFFAAKYIRAGTELTWDYNYTVGSVPGKILYCYCGSADCRGRLL